MLTDLSAPLVSVIDNTSLPPPVERQGTTDSPDSSASLAALAPSFGLAIFTAVLIALLLALESVAGEPPTVLQQPEDQARVVGSTVHFNAVVSGHPPVRVQWRAYLGAVFTNIPHAIQSALTLSNIQPPNFQIALFASNDFGSVTSRVALLAVLRPAAFTREPSSVVAVEGAQATLRALGLGTAPLRYQWLLEGQPILGRTNATLSYSRVSRTNEGDYALVVSNAFGSATSRVARLRVTPPPSSLSARLQPGDQPFQLRYRLFVPPVASNSPVGRLPLVMSLHGSGERGIDNISQLRSWPQSLVFVAFTNQARFPAFFVAPQCPQGWDWNQPDMVEKLFSLLDQLMLEFPVDPDRLYITGLSMGGFGSWELPRHRSPYFAAAIPIAGGGSTANAADLKDLAIWNFHSANDANVAVIFSRDMVQAVRDAGGRPIYTEYASGGHEIWANAWATPGLVEWAFGQRRGQPSRTAPDLQLTSLPRKQSVSFVGVSALSVSGIARLLGEPLLKLSWTNITTTESGFGEGSGTWSVGNIPLIPYLANDIVFIGATHSFAPELGGATTVSETRSIVHQPPAQLTVAKEGEMLRISWSGGMPPRILQSASTVDQNSWDSISTNSDLPLQFPFASSNLYFRVISGMPSL